jgi:hypothetical protein
MRAAVPALVSLANATRTGNATAVHFARAAQALEQVFADWIEGGLSAHLEQRFMAGDFPATDAHKLYLAAKQGGLAMDEAEYLGIVDPYANVDREKFSAYVREYGVVGLQHDLVNLLNNRASALTRNPDPRFHNANSFCFYSTWIGAYVFFAGLAVDTTVMGAPVGVIMNVVGIAAVLIGLYCS